MDAQLARFRGTLVGVAVGDAFGAPFEGWRGPVPARQMDRVLQPSAQADRPPVLRQHTDDTVMTIGFAESLLACSGLDEDHLASTWAGQYVRDPDRGYGSGAARLLCRFADGEDWRSAAREQFGGDGSWGNGGAMRVAPAGLLAAGDPARAAELGRRSAGVTHAHPLGLDGAAVQAAAVARLVVLPADEPVDGVALAEELGGVATEAETRETISRAARLAAGEASDHEVSRTLGNGVAAVEAVPAALCSFLRDSRSFAAAVRFAIGLGGDTDTIAAMAGALAGARLGEDAIPADWAARTEGVDRLVELADRLAVLHSADR